MDIQEIEKDIKNKSCKPLYFLHGEESFYIDQLIIQFEKSLLEESEKAFNLSVYYGRDVNAKQVIDTARRYPMMAPYQVVIIKEAQDFKKHFADMISYIESPSPTTVLVFAYKNGKIDGRSEFAKKKKKNGVLFESKKLYDNQVAGWIQKTLKSKQLSIDDQALDLMAEYIGTDLSRLHNEIEKLAISVNDKGTITSDLIARNIGISKEFNAFELCDALAIRDAVKVYRITQYFIANPKSTPVFLSIGTLHNFFSKCLLAFSKINERNDKSFADAIGLNVRNEYAAKHRVVPYRNFLKHYTLAQCTEVIDLIFNCDLEIKGVNNPSQSAEGTFANYMDRIIKL